MKNFNEITPQQINLQKAEVTEGEITPDQEKILESAIIFVEYLTDHWPQVYTPEISEGMETETRLNYYLAGSLATMLLACAESFTEIDETQIPALVEVSTRKIPESARKILASFARQVGDLDYVPMDHYEADPKRLKKGGGGPSFDEVPEAGRKVSRRGKNQIMVMCDPVPRGIIGVVKVNVRGRDYYIARPDTILAYKVLHLLESYETEQEKFNVDFGKLFSALKEMYKQEELIQTTRQLFAHYEVKMEALNTRLNTVREKPEPYEKEIPKFIERVLANQELPSEIRTVLESLREQK